MAPIAREHLHAVLTATASTLTQATQRRRRGADSTASRLISSMEGLLGHGKHHEAGAPAPTAATVTQHSCGAACSHQHTQNGVHHHHHHHEAQQPQGQQWVGRLHNRSDSANLGGDLPSASTVTTRMHAAAICCPMESRLIHRMLDSVPGVQSVDVMVVTKMVAVCHDPSTISPAALVAALNSAGLQASLNRHAGTMGAGGSGRGSTACEHGCYTEQAPRDVVPRLARLLALLQHDPSAPPLLVLVSGLLLVVNLLLLLPGLPTPELLRKGLLALVAACIAVPPVLRKAWTGLRNRNLDMNSLVVVAMLGAIGLGDFYEAGALVVLFTLAEWLEERCVSRAAVAMEDILKLQPETALVLVEHGGFAAQQQEHKQQAAACAHAHRHGAHEHRHQHSDGGGCNSHSGEHEHAHSSSCSHGSKQSGVTQSCAAGGGGLALADSPMGFAPAACAAPPAAPTDSTCCGHEHEHHHAACGSAESGRAQLQSHSHPHEDHHGAGAHGGCCGEHQQHAHEHTHAKQQQPGGSGPAIVPMAVSQLLVGALVLVRPGDKVPVDGNVEAGSSVVDESMVTGESRPVSKAPGEAVLAGTVNCGSVPLRVRATAAASDSTVARLGALMEAAAASKSRHDMAVETFARYYTPAIVAVAALTAGLGSALQPAAWSHWCYMALVVLVTGCPCALVISTPVASVAGLTRAAKKGVLIKGGRSLELLGSLAVASFDKSGTLTEGHFQLTKLRTFGGFDKQQVLRMAAALEQHSNHPIAHAIVGVAAAGGCMSGGGADAASDVREVGGKGLQGSLQGKQVAVGSWAFAQELLALGAHSGAGDEDVAAARALLDSADTAGCTVVCLVVDGRLAGLLLLSDRPRADALAALEQLQALGVRCVMMTGDTMGAAAHVATQLGLPVSHVCAELLPHEKLDMIGTLRHRTAVEQARARHQGGSWLRRLLPGGFSCAGAGLGSRPNSDRGGTCSGCGEPSSECSCRAAVLAPNSSGSSGGGIIGGAAAGIERMRRGMWAAPGAAAAADDRRSGDRRVVIAHVGDGVNDAPALAGADVGVAMGVAGAALAVDAADVALFNNHLTSLPFVVRLGRRAAWVIAANTVFACGIKVAVLGAAAGGVASLWLSLLADVGSSLLVTLHALTLLRFEAGSDGADAGSVRSGSTAVTGGLLGSRLSGIHVAPDVVLHHEQEHGAQAAGGSSASWWRRALQWLKPYAPLPARTPAASAEASRLGSVSAPQQLREQTQHSDGDDHHHHHHHDDHSSSSACCGGHHDDDHHHHHHDHHNDDDHHSFGSTMRAAEAGEAGLAGRAQREATSAAAVPAHGCCGHTHHDDGTHGCDTPVRSRPVFVLDDGCA